RPPRGPKSGFPPPPAPPKSAPDARSTCPRARGPCPTGDRSRELRGGPHVRNRSSLRPFWRPRNTCARWRHDAQKCLNPGIDSGPSTSQVKHRFSKNSQDSHVAKSDLGTKRICPTTGKKFYDLNKSPVISPYTGEVVPIAPVAPPRMTRGAA